MVEVRNLNKKRIGDMSDDKRMDGMFEKSKREEPIALEMAE